MFLIIDNLDHKKIKLWLYNLKAIKLIAKKEYSGNELLGSIADFLKKSKLRPEQIKYIGIIEGKGSFTGIRTAANIANVFSLYNETKIFGLKIKNLNSKNIEREIIKLDKKTIGFYSPRYSAPPRITIFSANKQKSK